MDDKGWRGIPNLRRDAQQRVRSPSPRRPWSRDQWAPSQRQKRKYASLFKRTDFDNDGYIQGNEASDLLERSKLDRPRRINACTYNIHTY